MGLFYALFYLKWLGTIPIDGVFVGIYSFLGDLRRFLFKDK